MGCLLLVQSHIDIVPQFLQWCAQYHVILDRVITALVCISYYGCLLRQSNEFLLTDVYMTGIGIAIAMCRLQWYCYPWSYNSGTHFTNFLFHHNSNSIEISFSSNSKSNDHTCHNITTAVLCAKYCSYHFIRNWMRAKWNFQHIWIVMDKLLVKWAPGFCIIPIDDWCDIWHWWGFIPSQSIGLFLCVCSLIWTGVECYYFRFLINIANIIKLKPTFCLLFFFSNVSTLK